MTLLDVSEPKKKSELNKSVTVGVYTRLVQVPGLWWCVLFPLLGGSESF